MASTKSTHCRIIQNPAVDQLPFKTNFSLRPITKTKLIQIFTIFAGISLFTPILPWTGRHDYRPIWEIFANIDKFIAEERVVNGTLLNQKYRIEGKGEKEAKCLAIRDTMTLIMEAELLTHDYVIVNLGFRSTSVPAFWIVNNIGLSVLLEIMRIEWSGDITQSIADQCKDFPGRFISPSSLKDVLKP